MATRTRRSIMSSASLFRRLISAKQWYVCSLERIARDRRTIGGAGWRVADRRRAKDETLLSTRRRLVSCEPQGILVVRLRIWQGDAGLPPMAITCAMQDDRNGRSDRESEENENACSKRRAPVSVLIWKFVVRPFSTSAE